MQNAKHYEKHNNKLFLQLLMKAILFYEFKSRAHFLYNQKCSYFIHKESNFIYSSAIDNRDFKYGDEKRTTKSMSYNPD